MKYKIGTELSAEEIVSQGLFDKITDLNYKDFKNFGKKTLTEDDIKIFNELVVLNTATSKDRWKPDWGDRYDLMDVDVRYNHLQYLIEVLTYVRPTRQQAIKFPKFDITIGEVGLFKSINTDMYADFNGSWVQKYMTKPGDKKRACIKIEDAREILRKGVRNTEGDLAVGHNDEALSKFMRLTNELRDTADKLKSNYNGNVNNARAYLIPDIIAVINGHGLIIDFRYSIPLSVMFMPQTNKDIIVQGGHLIYDEYSIQYMPELYKELAKFNITIVYNAFYASHYTIDARYVIQNYFKGKDVRLEVIKNNNSVPSENLYFISKYD